VYPLSSTLTQSQTPKHRDSGRHGRSLFYNKDWIDWIGLTANYYRVGLRMQEDG